VINLYNQDCLEAFKTMQDKQFQIALVDPPYGIPKVWGSAGKLVGRIMNESTSELKKWDVAPTENYFKELFRVSENQIIWGGNYFSLPPTRGIICWDKVQPWENFSAWEFAWTSFNVPAKLFKFDNRTGDKIHPTQKPVALYKWLLTKYAKQGDKILDTHLGSGSIAIAAHDLGYDLEGYEIDKSYYDKAVERFENHKKQMVMF